MRRAVKAIHSEDTCREQPTDTATGLEMLDV